MNDNFELIRHGLASLDAAAAHEASGAGRPKVEEIFAPEQHAGALDPNVTIVLGARGAGKSFWAGVLGNEETRLAAAEAYPRLGLDRASVQFGFTGLPADGSVSRQTIDQQIPAHQEHTLGVLLWRCVILRAIQSEISPGEPAPRIKDMMQRYSDSEEWEAKCDAADRKFAASGRKVVIVFDALDGLAVEWGRLRNLTDALLEVAWSTRGYRAVRTKLFLRPDQIKELGLRFVELPKLIAGATNLRWTGTDLYGMLFTRLGGIQDPDIREAFEMLLEEEGVTPPPPPKALKKLRSWPLASEQSVQARVFTRLAGAYMGRGHKKGGTYAWPLKHLSDGHGEVTPRSFMTLMTAAARFQPQGAAQVISAEGIRHGLREASKIRVEQLALEFPWIKRVLAPLARLRVPCTAPVIADRWEETETVKAILGQAAERGFLPPFDAKVESDYGQALIQTLVRIGVLTVRTDDEQRYDMPDLFRVAARLLKKGGVAPG